MRFGAGPIKIGKVMTRYYNNQATLTPPQKKHIIDQLKWEERCSNITAMKRMLPIHTHTQQTKQENITKGLAMHFGAGSIIIDIELHEYEPEKATIHASGKAWLSCC